MLDTNLKSQLRMHFQKILQPVDIVTSVDAGANSTELIALLQEIAGLTDRIAILDSPQSDERIPSFSIRQSRGPSRIRFAATPTGPEFSSLILALLQVGGHPVKAEQASIEKLKTLNGDYCFETYISLSCASCVDVVQALNMMAVVHPKVRHITIDGGFFPNEVKERDITVVPTMYLNGELFGEGRHTFDELVEKLSDIEASLKAALQAVRTL